MVDLQSLLTQRKKRKIYPSWNERSNNNVYLSVTFEGRLGLFLLQGGCWWLFPGRPTLVELNDQTAGAPWNIFA
jgi:hypothetical protein